MTSLPLLLLPPAAAQPYSAARAPFRRRDPNSTMAILFTGVNDDPMPAGTPTQVQLL
jgi:hypothetical protein